MKTVTKYTIGAAMATALTAGAIAGSSTTNTQTATKASTANANKTTKLIRVQAPRHFYQRHFRMHRVANFGFHRNMRFDKNQARTITKADLLLQGRKHLYPGEIKLITNKRGHNNYMINIMNKKQKVVKQVVFNGANGHIRPYYS